MATNPTGEEIREAVRATYADAAKRAQAKEQASCCGAAALYRAEDLREVPDGANLASLGCGNPTLLAELRPGEVVLDLGSGGGIDVLLSAKRVGSTGKTYGLDMTDEMLDLARGNARQAGVENVEFLKGNIESIPLPDNSVDVIISNCVINLSADKDAVLAEAFRVLKPGGRFAVADIVVEGGPLPPAIRRLLALWAGCVSGALGDLEYRQKLGAAGFEGVELRVLEAYGVDRLSKEASCCNAESLALPKGTRVVSAFVKAIKPGR